ncbi:MAG: fimbria/pilus periplasmic chaperone [Polyangiaceae bacterium]|nr:fimbria/pilus periplasmic chaperone [Polyangiaceae bacterium]
MSPVRLDLNAQASNGLLTVQNQSGEPLRFQLTAFEWKQTPQGEVVLQPTSDVAVFPAMVTIPAGASRKVRVGVLVPAGASEKTYRVIVEELPSANTGKINGVKVLTRMSVPVFFAATAPSSRPGVEGLSLQQGQLRFQVKNGGNTHFMNTKIRVVTRNSAGQQIQENALKGWYVLGGDSRHYDLTMPLSSCAGMSSISVEIETDQGSDSATLGVSSSGCQR